MGRVDRIALNLANVATPGYKREVVAVKPFARALEEARPAAAGAPPAQATGGPGAQAAVAILADARPGTIKVTGHALDLALVGDGFFEVMTEAGPAYTRQGDLQVDARGRLATARGHPVMGTNGEIVLTTQRPAVDAAGNVTEPGVVTAPGTPLARIKVVRFERPGSLQRLGDGLLAAGEGMALVPGDGSARIRQGALENANVSSMHEMVQLIETMRHFESMQKVAQGYDELLGMAIRKLGDLS
jgi:flagellar basal-body rod protein FlgG